MLASAVLAASSMPEDAPSEAESRSPAPPRSMPAAAAAPPAQVLGMPWRALLVAVLVLLAAVYFRFLA